MSFPMFKLSTKAAIAASEQMVATTAHLESDPVETRIVELVHSVVADTETAKKSLHKTRKGELTEKIHAAYEQFQTDFELFRDSAELTFRKGIIKNGPGETMTPKGEAAEKVVSSIHTHGRTLHKQSRVEALGTYAALMADFDTKELEDAVSAAFIDEELDRVNTSYINLQKLVQESASLEQIKSEVPCQSEAGAKLKRSLSNLYNTINTFAEIGNANYTAIAANMEEVLDKFRAVVSDRQKESAIPGEEIVCEEPHCSDHEEGSESPVEE